MATLYLGDTAPDFTAITTAGSIQFHEWIENNWVIFFSHPADFTPVCTTELGAASRLSDAFASRNVKMIALSVDALEEHQAWIHDINETQQTTLQFPIIADQEQKISRLYGMIHPNASMTHTVRSVFIIAPDKTIRLMITYPASTGRNFDELLRVIDSLQLTDQYKVVTPANWKPGEDCIIIPSMKNEEAVEKFPKGFKEIKPYLRFTPQPDK